MSLEQLLLLIEELLTSDDPRSANAIIKFAASATKGTDFEIHPDAQIVDVARLDRHQANVALSTGKNFLLTISAA